MSKEPAKTKRKLSRFSINIILLLLVVMITAVPLVFMKNAEFSGSDDQAKKAITQINGDYKPWFSPIWQPPSGEIEGLLFALQAAIGAGLIGYALGYWRGQKKKNEEDAK